MKKAKKKESLFETVVKNPNQEARKISDFDHKATLLIEVGRELLKSLN